MRWDIYLIRSICTKWICLFWGAQAAPAVRGNLPRTVANASKVDGERKARGDRIVAMISLFWQHGYLGIMITETPPFRYAHYHEANDTPDKLDYDRFTLVVSSVEKWIVELAERRH